MWVSSFPTPFIEEVVFSSTYTLDAFVKNQMAIVWAYFWIFFSISLLCVSGLGPVPCCFCYYGSVE
jgi:hypothetical protein